MDMNAIVGELSSLTTQAGQSVQSTISAQDINDPESMLRAQFALNQYSNYVGYESAIIKTMKDMIQGIISKI
jgi:type III secretion protein F